ncbi:hypothetical protein GGR54DRAFT_283101 [Hypoxylon sp. NC1633]|nr:hypothetical protein GGR54DRAFT_283101 [Hypoxylon sp. NC1633]
MSCQWRQTSHDEWQLTQSNPPSELPNDPIISTSSNPDERSSSPTTQSERTRLVSRSLPPTESGSELQIHDNLFSNAAQAETEPMPHDPVPKDLIVEDSQALASDIDDHIASLRADEAETMRAPKLISNGPSSKRKATASTSDPEESNFEISEDDAQDSDSSYVEETTRRHGKRKGPSQKSRSKTTANPRAPTKGNTQNGSTATKGSKQPVAKNGRSQKVATVSKRGSTRKKKAADIMEVQHPPENASSGPESKHERALPRAQGGNKSEKVEQPPAVIPNSRPLPRKTQAAAVIPNSQPLPWKTQAKQKQSVMRLPKKSFYNESEAGLSALSGQVISGNDEKQLDPATRAGNEQNPRKQNHDLRASPMVLNDDYDGLYTPDSPQRQERNHLPAAKGPIQAAPSMLDAAVGPNSKKKRAPMQSEPEPRNTEKATMRTYGQQRAQKSRKSQHFPESNDDAQHEQPRPAEPKQSKPPRPDFLDRSQDIIIIESGTATPIKEESVVGAYQQDSICPRSPEEPPSDYIASPPVSQPNTEGAPATAENAGIPELPEASDQQFLVEQVAAEKVKEEERLKAEKKAQEEVKAAEEANARRDAEEKKDAEREAVALKEKASKATSLPGKAEMEEEELRVKIEAVRAAKKKTEEATRLANSVSEPATAVTKVELQNIALQPPTVQTATEEHGEFRKGHGKPTSMLYDSLNEVPAQKRSDDDHQSTIQKAPHEAEAPREVESIAKIGPTRQIDSRLLAQISSSHQQHTHTSDTQKDLANSDIFIDQVQDAPVLSRAQTSFVDMADGYRLRNITPTRKTRRSMVSELGSPLQRSKTAAGSRAIPDRNPPDDNQRSAESFRVPENPRVTFDQNLLLHRQQPPNIKSQPPREGISQAAGHIQPHAHTLARYKTLKDPEGHRPMLHPVSRVRFSPSLSQRTAHSAKNPNDPIPNVPQLDPRSLDFAYRIAQGQRKMESILEASQEKLDERRERQPERRSSRLHPQVAVKPNNASRLALSQAGKSIGFLGNQYSGHHDNRQSNAGSKPSYEESWQEAVEAASNGVVDTLHLISMSLLDHLRTREESVLAVVHEYKRNGTKVAEKLARRQAEESVKASAMVEQKCLDLAASYGALSRKTQDFRATCLSKNRDQAYADWQRQAARIKGAIRIAREEAALS